MKTGNDFNSSLLGAGTTDATPMLLSLPVIVDASVPDYSGVVVDQSAVVSAVGHVKVATSEHQYFSRDSVLLRATWRSGTSSSGPTGWEPSPSVAVPDRRRAVALGFFH
jgi:hypothetical protein